MKSNDLTVWYYGVLDGRTLRAPINLRTREIDWSRAEPYTEPPLKTPMPRFKNDKRRWQRRNSKYLRDKRRKERKQQGRWDFAS